MEAIRDCRFRPLRLICPFNPDSDYHGPACPFRDIRTLQKTIENFNDEKSEFGGHACYWGVGSPKLELP